MSKKEMGKEIGKEEDKGNEEEEGDGRTRQRRK